ncbi:MAG: hypothetical protein EA397_17450 [Deltaproteobacteria bacterium]|nr:MAG: hypothetical protein EA397_17450 [Deltaproteobacteria bacterium]
MRSRLAASAGVVALLWPGFGFDTTAARASDAPPPYDPSEAFLPPPERSTIVLIRGSACILATSGRISCDDSTSERFPPGYLEGPFSSVTHRRAKGTCLLRRDGLLSCLSLSPAEESSAVFQPFDFPVGEVLGMELQRGSYLGLLVSDRHGAPRRTQDWPPPADYGETGEVPSAGLRDVIARWVGSDLKTCGLREGVIECFGDGLLPWHRSGSTYRALTHGPLCGLTDEGSLSCASAHLDPPAGAGYIEAYGIWNTGVCALHSSGEIRCSTYRTTADGPPSNQLVPPKGRFVSMVANEWLICGLTSSDEVVCEEVRVPGVHFGAQRR